MIIGKFFLSLPTIILLTNGSVMKNNFFLLVSLLILLLASCSKGIDSQLNFGDAKYVIDAKNVFSKMTPQDSLFSSITLIPLETTDDCLIRMITGLKIQDSLIYINSFFQELLVFDFTGKFVRKIGSLGNGPGEFNYMGDFLFTDEGDIQILDFKQILTYSKDGKFKFSQKFDFTDTKYYCNADKFAKIKNGDYFLWGGNPGGGDDEFKRNIYMMYKVNSKLQMESRFFPLGNGDGGNNDRFRKYNDTIIFAPYQLDNSLYQIDDQGNISVRYYFDFGKYSIKNKVKDPSQHIDIKNVNIDDLVTGIDRYSETDNWLFTIFSINRKGYSILTSKKNLKSYCLSGTPAKDELRFYMPYLLYEDTLVSVIDAHYLLEEMERMDPVAIEKWNLHKIKDLDPADNQVVLLYTFK